MMTTATHSTHGTTPERILFLTCELREKTWKLGFTAGAGQKPRERGVTARHQERVLDEIAQAKRRFGLSETPPVISCTGSPESCRPSYESFLLRPSCR